MGAASQSCDVVVVGAGIVGLGTAWAAAKRGAKVILLESSPRAAGGSVRNFGMVWPIGQPAGERFALALRNRELWLELATSAGISIETCGSLHLAHHDDELETLAEFVAEHCDPNQSVRMLTAAETLNASPCANPNRLRGAMWSDTECRIDPRQAIAFAAQFLSQNHGVDIQFQTHVAHVDATGITTSTGARIASSRVFICSGADFERLFPYEHTEAGLIRCKLQMMRTVPVGGSWRLGPHLASGLTLRHYEAFRNCPSQVRVRERFAAEAPELDRFGIHVMASQALDGELVLGDSHEYGNEIEPFDKAEIDQFMLRELRKVFRLPTWDIQQTWNGVYAKLPDRPYMVLDVPSLTTATIINGFGGAGMSLSLAVTEQAVATRL